MRSPARPKTLPLADASVDGAVCSDAWHWFDGRRAADELARAVRPGGGVVICILWDRWVLDSDEAPAWWRETGAVMDALWQAVDHPHGDGPSRPDGFDDHPDFAPLEPHTVDFMHRYPDRAAILAHYASVSFVATLSAERRAATLAELDEILARHRIDGAQTPYRAHLWVTRRRPA